MGVTLTKQQLENIKSYEYKTTPPTYIESHFLDTFWDAIVKCLPSWLAPNVLTLLGVTMPIALLVVICQYSPDFGETLPNWISFLGFVALVWFQTFDAIDGKQARKTKTASPLG
jgi:hypothetical protein